MKAVEVVTGTGVPLKRSDVDTDQIIPAVWLKQVERTGFEKGLFSAWRDEQDFVLNDERFVGANILVAGPAFGVGSSREHAPWALLDYGFKAIISTEIADIFRNNSLKNGLVPVVVNEDIHRWLIDNPGQEINIDVEASTLTLPTGAVIEFPMDGFARYCIVEGIDQLGFLQKHETQVRDFEENRSWTP